MKAPDVYTPNVKVGRDVRRRGGRNVEVAANVFDLFGGGDYTVDARTGTNRIYNRAGFLTYTNPRTPRVPQVEAVVRF